MADPDLQIRGEGHSHPDPVIRGGELVSNKIFSALPPQFGLKIRVGWTPRALLLDLPLVKPGT